MRRYLKWEDNDKNVMAWTHEWVLSHFIDPVRIDDEADIFFFSGNIDSPHDSGAE